MIDDDTEVVTTPRACPEDGSGCISPTLSPSTEGLIDDEDYSLTDLTNQEHGSGSGSGEGGSGMGRDTQQLPRKRSTRRKRRNVGVAIREPRPGTESHSSEQADFQSMVREIVQEKKLFEARFREAKKLTRARKEDKTVSSLARTKEKIFGDKVQHHDTIHHNYGVLAKENAAIVYLHEQDALPDLSGEIRHRA